VAERIRTRLLSQVDERRSPRTRATVGQLLDRWLGVLDVDPSTRRTYEGYIRKHIRPLLGSLSLSQTAAWTCSTKWAPVLPGSGSSTTRTGTGQPEGVSEAVLEAMATALQLDQSECGHMFDVAKATSAPATPGVRRSQRSKGSGQPSAVAGLHVGIPAFVRNGRLDILGTTR
jgi:hypothetical protein